MIKEEKCIVYIDTEDYVLRVQELLWGLEPWPEKFRAQITALAERKAARVYDSTGREVAERAMEYLSCFSGARTWLSSAKSVEGRT
jgi:hypothetical protein